MKWDSAILYKRDDAIIWIFFKKIKKHIYKNIFLWIEWDVYLCDCIFWENVYDKGKSRDDSVRIPVKQNQEV